jgi:hypothetical protein
MRPAAIGTVGLSRLRPLASTKEEGRGGAAVLDLGFCPAARESGQDDRLVFLSTLNLFASGKGKKKRMPLF